METNKLDVIVKIAACVCGKDGLISQSEEAKIFEIITKYSPAYSAEHFDSVLNDFFNEDTQIEEYLELINEPKAKLFCVALCKESASADGLDIKENIALQKVRGVLGVNYG